MNIKMSIVTLRDKLLYSIKLYPLASLFALIFTIASIVVVDSENIMEPLRYGRWMDAMLASSFGFMLIVALYHGRRDALSLTGGVLVSLLYFWSLPLEKEYLDGFVFLRHVILMVIALLMLSVLPFLRKGETNLKFWAWSLTLLLALISSSVFGFILYGGFAGAMKATSVLFEFEIHGKYYGYLFAVVMGIFSTHYFLASLKLDEIDTDREFYNRIGNFFVRYILTSIASVYALILSLYVLKILFSMEWPNGVLVWLSLAFATLSLSTYLFWTPLGGKYRKTLLVAALVQMSMLFAAIYMRVSQYGWSSDRYMVMMMGVWFVWTFAYLIFSKKAKYELPFAVLALLLFISQYGWKLSAYEVSDRSQGKRLVKLLAENSKLSQKSPLEVRCGISSSIASIDSHHNNALLNEIIPDIVKQNEQRTRGSFPMFATKALGFDYRSEWECANNKNDRGALGRSFSRDNNGPVSISGYDTLVIPNYNLVEIPDTKGNNSNKLFIKEGEKVVAEFDMTPWVKSLLQNFDDANGEDHVMSLEQRTFITENATIAVKVYFDYVSMNQKNQIVSSSGIILMKKKHQ